MSKITARHLAIDLLQSLFKNRLPVRILLERASRKYDLPSNERNLAMHLIYGVLRNRDSLDRILSILSKTPLKKLHPFVHQALAVGLYQLFYMDRIPQSAAVNEVVKSCKAAAVPRRLHGFVNAILREAIRRQPELLKEAELDSNGSPLLNHPHWLTRRWHKQFGQKEMQRICHSNNQEPSLVLQTNKLKTARKELSDRLTASGVANRPSLYSSTGIKVDNFQGPISAFPGYDEGLFYIQDEAAQLAVHLLGPAVQHGRYLDGCAGLGGKTAGLFQQLNCPQDTGGSHTELVAVEPEARRTTLFKENMDRLFDSTAPTLFQGTLQEFSLTSPGLFDGIFIDAPCSGTGVIGRQPDIRWHRQAGDLDNYQKQQMQILSQAAGLCAPGAVLVYATCSLEPEENERVIEKFLDEHATFQLDDCRPYLPEAAHKFIEGKCFSPRPQAGIDGFFAARLIRS